MGKLIFKYGVMGSHKTAEALIVRYQHIDRGHTVLLCKPDVDTRDDDTIRKVKSRIGIEAPCTCITAETDLVELYQRAFYEKGSKGNDIIDYPVLIIDEAQFLKPEQVTQLRIVADTYKHAKIYCYGLRTDSACRLFPGAKRLFELADELQEIESVCSCGRKAIVNARLSNGEVVLSESQLDIGGDDKYKAMCFSCWYKKLNKEYC